MGGCGEMQTAEMFLHLPVEPLRVKRGAAVDNHVGRRVIPVKKPSAVVAGERRHAVTRAEYVVGKAGAGVGKLFKFIIHRVGRAVEIAVAVEDGEAIVGQGDVHGGHGHSRAVDKFVYPQVVACKERFFKGA